MKTTTSSAKRNVGEGTSDKLSDELLSDLYVDAAIETFASEINNELDTNKEDMHGVVRSVYNMSHREQEIFGDSVEKTENGYKVNGVEIDENVARTIALYIENEKTKDEVRSFIDEGYGEGSFDKLSDDLADLILNEYNRDLSESSEGSLNNVIYEFKNEIAEELDNAKEIE